MSFTIDFQAIWSRTACSNSPHLAWSAARNTSIFGQFRPAPPDPGFELRTLALHYLSASMRADTQVQE